MVLDNRYPSLTFVFQNIKTSSFLVIPLEGLEKSNKQLIFSSIKKMLSNTSSDLNVGGGSASAWQVRLAVPVTYP